MKSKYYLSCKILVKIEISFCRFNKSWFVLIIKIIERENINWWRNFEKLIIFVWKTNSNKKMIVLILSKIKNRWLSLKLKGQSESYLVLWVININFP